MSGLVEIPRAKWKGRKASKESIDINVDQLEKKLMSFAKITGSWEGNSVLVNVDDERNGILRKLAIGSSLNVGGDDDDPVNGATILGQRTKWKRYSKFFLSF